VRGRTPSSPRTSSIRRGGSLAYRFASPAFGIPTYLSPLTSHRSPVRGVPGADGVPGVVGAPGVVGVSAALSNFAPSSETPAGFVGQAGVPGVPGVVGVIPG
jgi:hypothetical protein